MKGRAVIKRGRRLNSLPFHFPCLEMSDLARKAGIVRVFTYLFVARGLALLLHWAVFGACTLGWMGCVLWIDEGMESGG